VVASVVGLLSSVVALVVALVVVALALAVEVCSVVVASLVLALLLAQVSGTERPVVGSLPLGVQARASNSAAAGCRGRMGIADSRECSAFSRV
jgi:hypothetical protein